MPILSGGCACGAIRYACTAAPLFSLNCHCRDCQRESGSAFVPVLGVRKAAFAVSQLSPRCFEGTADTGHATTRAVCGRGGPPVLRLAGRLPEIVTSRAGTGDGPITFRP